MKDAQHFNAISKDTLVGLLGIEVSDISANEVQAEFTVTASHLAPNGYLHAGSVVTLADTACGHGCIANLPDNAVSFTTVELKSNHLGTARDGVVSCLATPIHKGRTTQVWDATVTHRETGKTIAIFRCTQMILYP